MKNSFKTASLFLSILFLISSCGPEKVSDIDGNSYKTVVIGSQKWFAENLKTTKLNDGTEIKQITENEVWTSDTTAAFSWYNNEADANKDKYGALFNYYAVRTGKLCPTGWHVPTESDWTSLSTTLEGSGTVGGKMKEAGTEHWKNPNDYATNESGFTALPGGYRSVDGIFNNLGNYAYFWSSSLYDRSTVLFWSLRYMSGSLYRYRSEKYCGFSVRCIADRK